MLVKNLAHKKVRIAALPIINRFMERLELGSALARAVGSERYGRALEVLIKNVLLDHAALYRIPQWAAQFDAEAMGAHRLNDDVIGRALDRLFAADRASLQTALTLCAIKRFDIDVSQIHNDSTTVKFYGAYKGQHPRAVQLKRGHSKDHRPDLKQLLYNLSVASDGAIPIHFKAYDGNRTDDTLHMETWLTLRGMLQSSSFLYVADAKLCVSKTMMAIDRHQGRFVTIVPETRAETAEFAEQCVGAQVRWEPVLRRPSTRHAGVTDVFHVAADDYQLEEGFRLYWYRSSEKRKRDKAHRKERLQGALEKLEALSVHRPRGQRTVTSLQKRADAILRQFGAGDWLQVAVTTRETTTFKKVSRGPHTAQASYRKVVKHIPVLVVAKNHEQIAKAKAMDGVFPLVTNTDLSAKETLVAYKYQPYIEKRFSGIKSDFDVSPAFLKKNQRIEALMFIIYLADLIAALIVRELRRNMTAKGLPVLNTLPEERRTTTPTWEQVQRLFAEHAKYELRDGDQLLKTFWDQLTEPQRQILTLLPISTADFAPPA